MNPDRRVSVKVSQAKKLSDEDIDSIVELLKAVFKDDPFDAMLVGGDLSLQPLQIRSTVEAAAIAGIVHIAYAPSLSQDADNQKDGTTNPGQLVGVALSFGPGQALNATMEQRAAGWDAFLGVIPESLRSWWDDYYGPLVSAGAKEAFGHDYRDRALKLSLFGVLPDHRGMGVGKALVLAIEDEAKQGRCPIVLQTQTETNVKIYTKLGFETKKATVVESSFGCSDFWFMEKRLKYSISPADNQWKLWLPLPIHSRGYER